MANLVPVFLAVGTGLQMISQIKQGQSEAAVASANAEISRMQARQTEEEGKYEVAKLEREKEQMLKRQRMAYLKSGVLISEGTPLAMMAQTATEYEMDIAALRYNSAVKAQQERYGSEIYKSSAKSARQLGYWKAGTTLLLGGAKVEKAREEKEYV